MYQEPAETTRDWTSFKPAYAYKAYTRNNYKDIPQVQGALNDEQLFEIDIVSMVLPFKADSYVVEELIDWSRVPDDPIYILTFPQKEMLKQAHFEAVAKMVNDNAPKPELDKLIHDIRLDLNPHPAGQMDLNVPMVNGERLEGLQHKYRETALFFPSQGQTCHAYCTFCFRWPQFVKLDDQKFASKEGDMLVEYLKSHPEVTDILFTGGDPMVMNARLLSNYIDPILEQVPSIRNIRIGTKSLAYWPYRFLSDNDTEEVIALFERVRDSGRHLAIMAHFNHYQELKTDAVKAAIQRLKSVGAQVRTQSPLLKNINDDSGIWAEMWKQQVSLGCIPYYMFMARDTGAQEYFAVTLDDAWDIFRHAYNQVSGIARTVRGPSMSAKPGKVHIVGLTEIEGEKAYVLRFIQGRDPEWVHQPFFAKYNPDAIWLNDLEPFYGDKFFFEN